MKKILLTCCALAIGASAGPVMAKDVQKYAVSKIEYKNRGAYSAEVAFRFNIKDAAEKTVTCKMNGKIFGINKLNAVSAGKEETFNLKGNFDFKIKENNPSACDRYMVSNTNKSNIPVGSEVWARINIQTGDSENCHKGNQVKFYYHPDGGTLTYLTRGTTFHNNRCRIQSKGGVLWEDVQ